jgi:hypothetical protein
MASSRTNRFGLRPGIRLGVGLLIAVSLVTGCKMVQTAASLPKQTIRLVTLGKNGQPAFDPVDVQQKLLRFADEFSLTMTLAMDRLQRGTNHIGQAELLRWKLTLGTESCTAASGPNSLANLLDITVMVTVTRMMLEDHWMPNVFGESARPLLESCRLAETKIWQIAAGVLSPTQLEELRQAIQTWHQQNPLPESAVSARAIGFTPRINNDKQTLRPDSVFTLFRIDPLAGMDPAVRELTETRMFAERAMFVTQKMPTLLRWQMELLSLDASELPTVRQLTTNATQVSSAIERVAGVAEKLPDQLSAERAAILQALRDQEKAVGELMKSGTTMSDSLNTTLTTFDALMQRFGVGETNVTSAADTNSEPFRIQAYTETAAQLAATSQRLTELLVTFDQTLGSTNLTRLSAQVGPVVEQAQASGKQVVDYAFWKAMQLVLIILGAMLIYRFIKSRWLRDAS